MVATDDGAGGDGKVEDSCNGNEATAAAALVSQMGAGEPMQVDGDGNFVLPQVDGPTDILLSEEEGNDKIDLDENPAPENITESVTDELTPMEQDDVNAAESIHAEEPTVREEAASEATADLPEVTPATDEVPEETEGVAENPPVNEETPMDISVDNAELPSEKEMDIGSPLTDEVKPTEPELPFVQSPAAQVPEKMPVTDVSDLAEPDATENSIENQDEKQDENDQTKSAKSETQLSKNEKSPAPEGLPAEDGVSQVAQDEVQETEKVKGDDAEPEANVPSEDSSLVKSENVDEPMVADSTSPATDAANQVPVTTPAVAPNVPTKLESADEPMGPVEQEDKLPSVPISSINGVAASLDKEAESPQKVHTPIKIDIKEEPAISKRENVKQEKINDARSDDDSTALSTLASAALGSTETSVKVTNEQVRLICHDYSQQSISILEVLNID